MLVVGVFVLFSALASGWLADRFGRKTWSRSAASSPPSALRGPVGADHACDLRWWLLDRPGDRAFLAANWALGTEIVPKEEAGRYLGISNLAGAGAGAVGAYIGGPIATISQCACRNPRPGLRAHLRHLWHPVPVLGGRAGGVHEPTRLATSAAGAPSAVTGDAAS